MANPYPYWLQSRGRLFAKGHLWLWGRGCLTEKQYRGSFARVSHRKIADKNRRTLSHEHTIFRDAIFPDACARTWWKIGGGKKTPPISRRSFCHHTIFRDTIFPDARGRGGNRNRSRKNRRTLSHEDTRGDLPLNEGNFRQTMSQSGIRLGSCEGITDPWPTPSAAVRRWFRGKQGRQSLLIPCGSSMVHAG